MPGNSELQRLDKLGREAARAVRDELSWMSPVGHHGNGARHTALGNTSRYNMPFVERLSIPIVLFGVICGLLSWGFGITQPGGYGLVAVILIEAVWYVLKRLRLARLRDQGISLQAQLHDLKEEGFELRYQQAKANGDLDRFQKTEKS